MSKELPKTYEPREVEDRLYAFWSEGGYFRAEVTPGKKPYTIVMPPPNITGQLHMGHALNGTLQDILIRWRRMQGFEALWVPGTDHAAIATEVKLVEALAAEGITKADLGREGFLERAWAWKDTYHKRITSQFKKMGISCDWSRERFTMDEGCSHAVKEVFVRLYEKGLIYRGERMINWCTCCGTSISDAEVEHEEKAGAFYHLRYPLVGGSGVEDAIVLATTRPETLLGDTAVAVHPEDERYAHLVGKTVVLPLTGREIPIIADSYVEREFGTGALKITPGHDPNDFEVGARHGLDILTVTTDDGHMNALAGRYEGMTLAACRKAIVADLEAGGYLLKIEEMTHNVGSCYRCKTVIEPRVSMQWFVRMTELAQPAIDAVKDGATRFVPERFEKIYFHWLENIKDWCVSRQLWWGHRIPAWYCADCGEITVSREEPAACAHCGGANIRQDEDTLDTWFSSALWPFSVLGWPDKTPEMDYFYPTNTLVTMYDIILFWVMRMMVSGLEQTGRVPFDTVFIHGALRDDQGRKMSKSLGNGIDPLEVVERYGADALRFMLATGNSPGNDMRFIEEKVESARNFANKLWNASRFILMNIGETDVPLTLPESLTREDQWILTGYHRVVGEMTENLEKFELGIALAKVYDFVWDSFCDWYIELCKPRLQSGEGAADALRVLVYVMRGCLRLLHPFMPFITEEIWQALPREASEVTIMTAAFPVAEETLMFPAAEREMERVMAVIRAIRNRRAEMNVPPSRRAEVFVETPYAEAFAQSAVFLQRLAGASEVRVGDAFDVPGSVSVVTADATVKIPLAELVDMEAERARLTKELETARKQLAGVEAKLGNAGFTDKAPPEVVATARDNAARLGEQIAQLEDQLAAGG